MSGLSSFQKFSYRLWGGRARDHKGLDRLGEQLRKARIAVRPEAYLSQAWTVGALAAVFTPIFLGLVAAILSVRMSMPPMVWLLVLASAPMGGYIGYLAIASDPKSKARKRAKDIDRKLPYATNYVAAMAGAGVIPTEIFRSLANQDIYGEVAREAAGVYKDLDVHGRDIVTALRRAMDRTPSTKFQDLLQGAISTITSGGDLSGYFRQKAGRYQWENRVEQKSFIETMGLMAETFVTAAVAGPLFLIVMVGIIVLMGSGQLSQLQLIVYLLLPVLHGGFVLGLKAMIPEV